MLVPLSWIREFVPYEGDAQMLGDRLTMLGLELEDILHPFDYLEQIKTGLVVQCRKHPDSDHLHLCKVDVGAGDLLDIVCGAPNVKEGIKVALAPIGAHLPDGTIIKKAKLRGQLSQGMICSERELGLSDDHSGIMILPDSVEIGHSLLNALDIERDVLEFSITPNRSDCLSILGLAREVALAFDLPLHVPDLPLIFDTSEKVNDLPITIENPDLCWLYSGRILTNIKIAPSPLKMRLRLIACGARPISNIVDITNYVLFETGQPLHAFDLQKIQGKKITVRTAKNGEIFQTLDGKERFLTEKDLCICDAKETIALAGVMGGLASEITEQTSAVFLESAVFQPQTIRKTARRLGINSEASFRFERGVDEQGTIWSLNRACALMASITGAVPNASFSCEEPKPFIGEKISYRPARAQSLLGVPVSYDFQESALIKDGCAVEKTSEASWIVRQPSWRPDLTREVDLIEEVGRIYGMNTIPSILPAIHKTLEENYDEKSEFAFLQTIKHWASGIGLNEAINFSFVGDEDLDRLNLAKDDRISIANPLSIDQHVLRTCLTPGLLNVLGNNLAFGASSIKVFEIANVFTENRQNENNTKETPFLGIILYGLRHEHGWPKLSEDFGYGDIKGLVKNCLNFMHINNFITPVMEEHGFLQPAIKIIVNDKTIGVMGKVKPQITKVFHAQKAVWITEINLEYLRQISEKEQILFNPLSQFPPVRRDITFIIPSSLQTSSTKITIAEIISKIYALKPPHLKDIELVDYFEAKENATENLTFRLTFRNSEKTLKDAEVDKIREKIATSVCKELNIGI